MVSPSNKFDIPTPHTFTSTFVFMIIFVSFPYESVLWENKLELELLNFETLSSKITPLIKV